MQPNWAEENLQVIRTLMERTGLYRRALAPVMLVAGLVGVTAAAIGEICRWEGYESFFKLWVVTAVVTASAAAAITRQQALRSAERFWTQPTARVVGALLPSFTVGAAIAVIPFALGLSRELVPNAASMVPLWCCFYGLALHSAGQVISRGVRTLGWVFCLVGGLLIYKTSLAPLGFDENGRHTIWLRPNCLMGLSFGGLHLLAAAYLYFTEKPEVKP